jgi:putative ABC transport system ATP-binding protein
MKESLVVLSDVTRDYGTDGAVTHALRGVSLEVGRGEFLAVAGPSGSGKTTLLNLVSGLDRPTAGSVVVDGRAVDRLDAAGAALLRRDRIGFVFQAYNLFPVLTAAENAEYVLMLQGVPSRERRDRVLPVLARVGLQGLADRFPGELSGGQQQRVAIARAIASEPALVLADEPTANLDSATSESLLDLMAGLNAERNVTFVFSTHDPRVMARARRLVVLRDGRIDQDGPPRAASAGHAS